MTPRSRARPVSRAAVIGGAVTREDLKDASGRGGRAGSPLLHSLLAQSLPSLEELAAAYAAAGSDLRLDNSFLKLTPKAAGLIDPELLRRERCLPVEIVEDICILAVESSRAQPAVEAVRAVLKRRVLPVLAEAADIDRALDELRPAPSAAFQGPLPTKDSPVHARFRDFVLDDAVVDALRATEWKA